MREWTQTFVGVVIGVFAVSACLAAGESPVVRQSSREIPVAYDVDVVVVGGSTGAVSAATAAARGGAKVFLAAPRPYLGDDMTATLRLWLEPGETPQSPLARQIFADPSRSEFQPDPNRLPFTYEADQRSSAKHSDTKPPRLTDGVWGDPAKESVQYDSDVTIVADLGKPVEIAEVRLMAFEREGDGGFKVADMALATSDDKKAWHEAATVKSPGGERVTLSSPTKSTTRYVRLVVRKAADASRILLGEIEILSPPRGQPAPAAAPAMPRPMHVKKTLDQALLDANVAFLYGCYATDVLRDAAGEPCGIVMANRAGRQAVLAKVIVDATDRGEVARLAGARFREFPAGPQTLRRVVIGGEICQGEGITARIIDPPFRGLPGSTKETSSGVYPVIEYTLRLPVKADRCSSWAAVEQQARTLTYHPGQQISSDALFQVPPDAMHGRTPADGPWNGVAALPLEAFRPAGVEDVYVVSGSADVSREQAERLLRPLALIDVGSRIGDAAAAAAKLRAKPTGVRIAGQAVQSVAAAGDVCEFLVGVRPIQKLPTLAEEARAIPVLGRYDVVVVGGGTTGAPAGIGAARRGAKTLVLESLHALGGVGTAGEISSYYWGNRVGFSATVAGGQSRWAIEEKMEWWRSNLLEAGADLWFGTIGCGAFVDEGRVKGVVVATPQGRGVVLANVVIDATGCADVAVAAGAASVYTDDKELAVQGSGLPPRRLGTSYTNTDFTIADDTDVVDIWHLLIYSKDKYADAFDQGQLVDTRERRRIVGDFTMTILDQILNRTYPDTIEIAYSNFDSHGYTVDPYLELEHPDTKGYHIEVPYRCLLPKGLEGILVGGLGMSVHRDALPMTRMQADLQNQGYAAGVAAAMAARQGEGLRRIDLATLRKHLIEIGNLPASVLEEKDSFPLPPERLTAAVESIRHDYKDVAVLLVQPEQALPLLRKAYQKAEGKDQLVYARVLAVLGDASGVETLLAEVKRIPEWDKGWNYRGMGQFGRAFSPLDELIVALGRTRDPRAVPAILERAKKLTAASDFSHHRAVSLALEMIGDRRAAPELAGMLTQPGISGNVHGTIAEARRHAQEGGTNAVESRRVAIRELGLARALYRCGDYGDLGKQVLTAYTKDLRGHMARHAQAVLDAGPKK